MLFRVCVNVYAHVELQPDFIDECCNLTGSHQQLSALTKDHSEVFTMSLWDIKTPFV